MDFGSYRDDIVGTAAGLVNQLTAGHDGTREFAVPDDVRALRGRARQVAALAGGRFSVADTDGFVRLAGLLRVVFELCEGADVDAAACAVNDLLAAYSSTPRLIAHDGQDWHLHFHGAEAGVVEGWGAGCATGLAIVIGSGEAGRLGVCSAAPCDRVFVDVSRNANRRFCSPRCANRFTVSAHRARLRS